jgi:U3 small nucleolar RNA-associated protein 14
LIGSHVKKKKSQKNRNSKKKKPTVRFADVDLNEDEDMAPAEEEEEEEEEEDGDPDEFIDLLDVLDGKGEIDMGSDNDKPVKSLNDNEDQSDEGESEEEEDDEQDAFAPSEEEEPIEASNEFHKFISSLDTTAKKRKADDGETGPVKDSRSRKRRLIAERTEAGAEDEFRAHASGI